MLLNFFCPLTFYKNHILVLWNPRSKRNKIPVYFNQIEARCFAAVYCPHVLVCLHTFWKYLRIYLLYIKLFRRKAWGTKSGISLEASSVMYLLTGTTKLYWFSNCNKSCFANVLKTCFIKRYFVFKKHHDFL